MKKTLKVVLALALIVAMMSTAALAATVLDEDSVSSISGTTINVVGGKLTVEVDEADTNEYVLLVVKAEKKADDADMSSAAKILESYDAGKVGYSVGEGTILYIDQYASNGTKVTFSSFLPKSITNSLIVLGGESNAKVVGAIYVSGISVSGTVTLKGADEADTKATIVSGDMEEDVTLTAGTASFSVTAPADATKITAKGTAGKYVDHEYDISEEAMALEVWPKGDVNGDGDTDLGDVTLVMRNAREIITLEAYPALCGDVNSDGDTDLGDCTLIRRHVREIIDLWATEE